RSASRKWGASVSTSSGEKPSAASRGRASSGSTAPRRTPQVGGEGEDDEQTRRDPARGRGEELLGELEHRPAAGARGLAEPRVGVDGDGMPDGLEERQVAVRVGVRRARTEIEVLRPCELAHRL